MTARFTSAAVGMRRLVWHPVFIAGCLTGLAVLAVLTAVRRPDLIWLAWVPLGATAGFATSGSV